MAFKITLPRLTPLQSRVAASSIATALVITIWVLWTLPSSAYSQVILPVDQFAGASGHHLHHVHPPVHHYTAPEPEDDDGPIGEHHDGSGNEAHAGSGSLESAGDDLFNPLFQTNPQSAPPQLASANGETDDEQLSESLEHDPMTGLLSKRQSRFLNTLVNDQKRNLNIEPGDVQLWGLDTEEIFRDADKSGASNVFVDVEKNTRVRTVYFTFNTCFQPTSRRNPPDRPPGILLYASNHTNNKSPGPNANPRQQFIVEVDEGFANVTVNATSTVYVSVVVPNITDTSANFSGVYNYDIIASTKQPYYGFYSTSNLYLIDSDNSNALFISGNETSYDNSVNVSTIPPPYTFFAHPTRNLSDLTGLRRSWCGLGSRAKLKASSGGGEISMTRRGLGNKVKEQIYLKGLEPDTEYNVWLARQNNETVGGWVYRSVRFTTKSDGNCRVIFDLNFCNEVAYAVPTNNTIFENMPRLAQFYDTQASSWYANFSYSLQQVQCNTTADREYSHLRGCGDCDRAYKEWLCATTIPRCADYSNNATFLIPRERGIESQGPTKVFLEDGRIVDLPAADSPDSNEPDSGPRFRAASRNSLIDEVVSPGRYKEIKPCMDLCWSLVQSCPASLGFSCPGGARGEMAYGERSGDGDITCSYLGAAYFLSGSERTMWLFGGLTMSLVAVLVGFLAGFV